MKPKKLSKEDRETRLVYIENRNNEIEICGMNYQHFAAYQVFFIIKTQEEAIADVKKYKTPYVNLQEEEIILQALVANAKEVFGSSYEEYYKEYVTKEKA
jgi:hypothetical protein